MYRSYSKLDSPQVAPVRSSRLSLWVCQDETITACLHTPFQAQSEIISRFAEKYYL